ncbi:MAG: 4-hydroxy-tetrahydrodipicolinate reductase, partial [Candidatus Hydrothermarchaeales archaeon]
SIGVNLVFDIAAQVAKALYEGFDIEIIEAHHRRKKDAPSGTALRIAERICEATKRNMETDVVYGRHGITGERPAKQIGIHAVRLGNTIGDHSVIFSSLDERIEINHSAHTRDIFARGAITAAKFIAGKPPGLYTIRDVLR